MILKRTFSYIYVDVRRVQLLDVGSQIGASLTSYQIIRKNKSTDAEVSLDCKFWSRARRRLLKILVVIWDESDYTLQDAARAEISSI